MSDSESESSDEGANEDRMANMLASYYGMPAAKEDDGGSGGSGSGGASSRPSAAAAAKPPGGGGRGALTGGGGGGGGAAGGRGGPSGGDGGGSGGAGSFGRIDAAGFDARGHVRHLLRTEPLESLLRQNDTLVHEVKALDSDMQVRPWLRHEGAPLVKQAERANSAGGVHRRRRERRGRPRLKERSAGSRLLSAATSTAAPGAAECATPHRAALVSTSPNPPPDSLS
jgi:hypothetical protein